MQIRPAAPPVRACGPFDLGHAHQEGSETVVLGAAGPRTEEVVTLTQACVQVDSGPTNLVAGQNQVADLMQRYAEEAHLQVDRFETVGGKPMLIVTLPGKNPQLGSVGFVHHADVVGVEGQWKLAPPYSGALLKDGQGRDILVGRGSLDTKGPACQILNAMKNIKASGEVLDRSMQLFVFPDEETGGKDGAYLLSQQHPEKLAGVQYWVAEGSGILPKEKLPGDGPAAYLAVAQKYSLPTQLELKSPLPPDEAVTKTLEALQRMDRFIESRRWTHLGSDAESGEAYDRMGHFVGGLSGWLLRNFWWVGAIQDRMGPAVAAANRSDFAKTDLFLTSNPAGTAAAPNVKPSSATALLRLDLAGSDREKALKSMRKAAGEGFQVTDEGALVRLVLPQESYQGGSHGSVPEREQDAVDRLGGALGRVRKAAPKNALSVVDCFTGKSTPASAPAGEPTRARATLDLRLAVDDDRPAFLAELARAAGPEFELKPLYGPELTDSLVRRLSHKSPLFQAAERQTQRVFGDLPILFGNTTATNDVRNLMSLRPDSEALMFTPVEFAGAGAHAPDEHVPVDSLVKGVDWCEGLMRDLGKR